MCVYRVLLGYNFGRARRHPHCAHARERTSFGSLRTTLSRSWRPSGGRLLESPTWRPRRWLPRHGGGHRGTLAPGGVLGGAALLSAARRRRGGGAALPSAARFCHAPLCIMTGKFGRTQLHIAAKQAVTAELVGDESSQPRSKRAPSIQKTIMGSHHCTMQRCSMTPRPSNSS